MVKAPCQGPSGRSSGGHCRARSSWVTADPAVLASLFFFGEAVQLGFFSAAGVLWRGYSRQLIKEGCSCGFSYTWIRSLADSSDSQVAAVSCAVGKEQVTFPLHCRPRCSHLYPSHTLRMGQCNTICMGLHLWGHSQTLIFLIPRQQFSSYSNGNAFETEGFPSLWQNSGQELPS